MFDTNLITYLDWLIAILNIASIIILLVGIFLVLKNLFDWHPLKKTTNSVISEMRKYANYWLVIFC